MWYICKEIEFDSSHRLWDNNLTKEENMKIFDKCANEPHHGHTYYCQIKLKSSKLKNGMIINFIELKKKVKELLIDKFDHHYINDLMSNQLATAENIAKLFYDEIKKYYPQLYAIRIYEGGDKKSWSEWSENE